jgi:hypothetical protein
VALPPRFPWTCAAASGQRRISFDPAGRRQGQEQLHVVVYDVFDLLDGLAEDPDQRAPAAVKAGAVLDRRDQDQEAFSELARAEDQELLDAVSVDDGFDLELGVVEEKRQVAVVEHLMHGIPHRRVLVHPVEQLEDEVGTIGGVLWIRLASVLVGRIVSRMPRVFP